MEDGGPKDQGGASARQGRHPGRRTFDYIIVGSGSAGCTLAYRLTEDPDARVLLLEAGGWDRDPWIHIPLGWGRILVNRLHDWMYFAEPEASVEGRRIECARGRVIGGSSSINAMTYARGHPEDYARWARGGLPDWSYEHALPYFQRSENWERGANAFRGGAGPLTTQHCRYDDPLVAAYIQAGVQAGHRFNDDYNAVDPEGFARSQSTIRNGRRCSAATAYLRPALRRRNLCVETRALATRVIMDGVRAIGVEYRRGGQLRTAHAAREVILCGGVINTPQLLMLSGVGDAGALKRQGVPPLIDLPGVGRNLQDHMSVALFYARKSPGPLHGRMRLDRIARDVANAYFFGRGVANDLPTGAIAFLKTEPSETVPDAQILFVAAPLSTKPYFPPFARGYDDGFSSRVVCLRPESRGAIELASADPTAAPLIRQNFFASQKDLVTLRKAVRLAREVARQPALEPFLARELAPGPAAHSDAAIDAYIRATAITVHHPLGTCRMGPANDRASVVDSELRVIGAENLRVVDASVMPDLVGGNINAPVIMIAEKASDLIRGRPLLAPAIPSNPA